jgi:1-acyl-sn-glycerol-3-phosphate acyltransferase
MMLRRSLRGAWEYLLFIAGLASLGIGCLLWYPVAMLLVPLLPPRHGRAIGRRVATHGFRLYLWFLAAIGACRFDLHELDALRDAGPLVIAPNHPSLIDAVLIVSRLPDVACVMKAELIDNPFFGAGARLARYIRNDSSTGALRAAMENLRAGSQLLLFPEGTRTTRAPINDFKGGAVLVAKHAWVPIQTVFIRVDTPFLSKRWPLLRKPALPVRYRVRLGKRFPPRENVKAQQAELQAYFAAELARDLHRVDPAHVLAPARPSV